MVASAIDVAVYILLNMLQFCADTFAMSCSISPTFALSVCRYSEQVRRIRCGAAEAFQNIIALPHLHAACVNAL
ncbi:uncharacterized protein PHALS_03354 [Plasmopara halstedii]|uniref:RxLR-like protein n=1 Tax=Plasmopara halstedii TaxID=4781 RepID=A0A0P1A897_PLAHL|nr:uncharacterized protein PHALS_03354 [Plasmopara halstedii]CEG36686.1 hypothetical protein PHALS_03354 [Plasmopara halstedii]|eukprot:XP_024573055.1 hypothetical protein PHALS_03354 [Plasmopara halstedii]